MLAKPGLRVWWSWRHITLTEVKFTSIPFRVSFKTEIKLKSLILAQIERWRHALHMQVERQHGSNPGGEWRTGE
jgi:hypothetical protein